jgi:tRNA A37 methylthiotransferase MiaB
VNVQRFISSGIIELYVAGMATEQEALELEAAMAQFPDLAAEVDACRRDMEQYVRMQAITPPPAIKDHLLRMVADETSECNNND